MPALRRAGTVFVAQPVNSECRARIGAPAQLAGMRALPVVPLAQALATATPTVLDR
jgi:hypothetical protein